MGETQMTLGEMNKQINFTDFSNSLQKTQRIKFENKKEKATYLRKHLKISLEIVITKYI